MKCLMSVLIAALFMVGCGQGSQSVSGPTSVFGNGTTQNVANSTPTITLSACSTCGSVQDKFRVTFDFQAERTNRPGANFVIELFRRVNTGGIDEYRKVQTIPVSRTAPGSFDLYLEAGSYYATIKSFEDGRESPVSNRSYTSF